MTVDLAGVAKLAESLKKNGTQFHEDFVKFWTGIVKIVIKEHPKFEKHMSRDKEGNVTISFAMAMAITLAGWTVASGHAKHVANCLAMIDSGDLAEIDEFSHIRKPVIASGCHFWMPFLVDGTLPLYPTADEVWAVFKTMHPKYDGSGKSAPWPPGRILPSWARTIPPKPYSLFAGWDIREINRMYVPLGRPVRDGIYNLLRIEVTESAVGYRDAVKMHRQLAGLANTDVLTINSGFWRAGEGGRVDDEE